MLINKIVLISTSTIKNCKNVWRKKCKVICFCCKWLENKMCTFLLCFCSIIKSATCSEGHQYGLGYGKRSFRKVSAFRQTQPQGFLMDSLLRYPMGYLSHRFHLCAPYVLPSAFPQYIPPRTFPSTLRTPTGSSENQTNRLPVCLLLLSLCIAVDHVRHIPR